MRGGPARVGLRQVDRRIAVHDPVGQHRAGARAAEEADRVEAGRHEVVAQPGRLAEVVQAVRGEALRAAEVQPDTGVGQDRQPLDHGFVVRAEVVPVLGQPGELGVRRDAAGRPRVTARLEEADHQPGALVLHVGVFRGGLDRGQAGRQARDRLGDDVVVGQRLQRDPDAEQRAELAAPHAGRVDHVLGLDAARGGVDPGHRVAVVPDAGDGGVLQDRDAKLAGPGGQRHRGVGGVAPAVVRVVHRAEQVTRVQRGEQLDRVVRGDQLGPDAVAVRGRRGPAQFRPAGLVIGQVQRAGALEARAEAGLLFQRLEDPQAALDDLPGAERGPGRRDEPGRVPGGARGQLPAFYQDDVGPAAFGQVVRGAAASYPAPHHDDPGGAGNGGVGHESVACFRDAPTR